MDVFDNLLITTQKFYMVLPNYGRYHFSTYDELVKYCKLMKLKMDDQDIRLGYDSPMSLNTFAFYDEQDFINGSLILKVERNQYRKVIDGMFDDV